MLDLLQDQNPWRSLDKVPTELAKPTERTLASVLWRSLTRDQPLRYQVVIGPRRVGKSTVMYQTVQRLLAEGIDPARLLWLRLDHPLLMTADLGSTVRELVELATSRDQLLYLFLDELTYAPHWDLWLKTFYDEKWPVRILATSSAVAALRRARVESGIGRWEEQYLPPWLFTEYLALRGRTIDASPAGSLAATLQAAIRLPEAFTDLERERRRYLLVGGFPELLTSAETDETSELFRSQRVLRSDAVQTAIYKDLPQVFEILEPAKLERLLYTLAGQICGVISPQRLATDLELSQPTIDRYIGFLEQAFLIFTLPNYSGNEETVQRRGRKLYFTDGAVRNAALQRGLGPLRDPGEMGLLYENVVASHLHALAQQAGTRLYHWRQGTIEVDLVFDDPEVPIAFEVASSSRHSTAGMLKLIERYPRFAGRCYLVAPGLQPLNPKDSESGIGRLPLDLLLVVLGHQVAEAMRRRVG